MNPNTLVQTSNIDAFLSTHKFICEKQAMGLIWNVRLIQKFDPKMDTRKGFTRTLRFKYETHPKAHYNVMAKTLDGLVHVGQLSRTYAVQPGEKDGEVLVVYRVKDMTGWRRDRVEKQKRKAERIKRGMVLAKR